MPVSSNVSPPSTDALVAIIPVVCRSPKNSIKSLANPLLLLPLLGLLGWIALEIWVKGEGKYGVGRRMR